MSRLALMIVCVVVLTSTGCTFFSPTSAPAAAAPEQNPRQLTQEWYAALGEFDTAKMYLITKPEKRPRLEDRLKRVDSVILGAADLQKQKFFEMRYSTLSGDGQLAQVRVIGKSSAVRTGLISNVDTTVDLVKENGRWWIWSVPDWF